MILQLHPNNFEITDMAEQTKNNLSQAFWSFKHFRIGLHKKHKLKLLTLRGMQILVFPPCNSSELSDQSCESASETCKNRVRISSRLANGTKGRWWTAAYKNAAHTHSPEKWKMKNFQKSIGRNLKTCVVPVIQYILTYLPSTFPYSLGWVPPALGQSSCNIQGWKSWERVSRVTLSSH